MKKIFFTLIIFFTTICYSQKWETNFEIAKKIAFSQKKNIILVFFKTKCKKCKKLDKKIWSSETFKNYAKDHYIMLKVNLDKENITKKYNSQKKNSANCSFRPYEK